MNDSTWALGPDELGKGPFVEYTTYPAGGTTTQKLAYSGLPIQLPWDNQKTVQLGTALFSSKLEASDGPWNLEDSPFLTGEHTPQATLTYLYGTIATFKSINTLKQLETKDHLSLGFGAGVGLPFIAKVSVKGQYDRTVEKNKDSNKSSIQSTVRAGTVDPVSQPKLSGRAKAYLRKNGLEAFEARYGNYYVASYRLGGDTAIMITTSASRTKKKETLSVKVTAEVLCFSKSTQHEKSFYSFDASKSIKFLGFDTLAVQNWDETCDGPENGEAFKNLYEKAMQLVENTHNMTNRLEDKLERLGLANGDLLSTDQCHKLGREGLIIELVLLPIRRLTEVLVLENDSEQSD